MKYLMLLFFCVTALQALSQEEIDELKFGSTEKTSKNPTYDSKNKPNREPKVRVIVKKDMSKALAGNKCFEDYLSGIGIRYEHTFKGKASYSKPIPRFFHNLGVKTITTIKRGPFWGIKVRKKRKECIRLTHDYLG